MYEGVIIKETLSDESFLDYLVIDKVEVVKTNDTIRYWTVISFHSDINDLPQRLANCIIEDWFADMKSGNTKYIIFKNKILNYELGNSKQKDSVLNYMRNRGIPESQITGSSSWNE